MKLLFLILLLIFTDLNSGELDGKGIICKVYGDTVGYFFESDRAFEFKPVGGESGLEIKKKDLGKYLTNENSIFINEIKINRKNLKIQKYSSFRGECEAYENFNSFEEGFDLEKLTKDNKI